MIISYYKSGKRTNAPRRHLERQDVMGRRTLALVVLVAGALSGCGGSKDAPSTSAGAGAPATGDLTPWQVDHGIGPITAPIVLAPIDAHLAKEGKELFEPRCGSCHKPNERYVGPALGGVVGRRTPEYVMNMMLAPDSMVARHPEAKKLFATFMLAMPNLGLTPEQAREVLEYLRTLPAPPALPAQ